jgi:predicted nucleotide-binding protein
MPKSYLFVSYAREDIDLVRPFVEAFRVEAARRDLRVDLWMDVLDLKPGELWDETITEALQRSIGIIFFVSPRLLQSASVRHELKIAAGGGRNRLIINVLLGRPEDRLPPELIKHQSIQFDEPQTRDHLAWAVSKLAGAIEKFLIGVVAPYTLVTRVEAPILAADIAREIRAPLEPAAADARGNSVFVVHGHDTEALVKLESYLNSVGIEAVVLSREDESPQSLFQKFMSVGGKARFAIVLLCADDYGASRTQYDASGVGERALQFRARQNVILELGFFYGRLGWESVFVVYQAPDRVFPNFERPSDLDGVVFASISDAGWQERLGAKLSTAGFNLRAESSPRAHGGHKR